MVTNSPSTQHNRAASRGITYASSLATRKVLEQASLKKLQKQLTKSLKKQGRRGAHASPLRQSPSSDESDEAPIPEKVKYLSQLFGIEDEENLGMS